MLISPNKILENKSRVLSCLSMQLNGISISFRVSFPDSFSYNLQGRQNVFLFVQNIHSFYLVLMIFCIDPKPILGLFSGNV